MLLGYVIKHEGKTKPGKVLHPNSWLKRSPKCRSSAHTTKQGSVSCRYHLQGISSRERGERGGWGQQRTGGLFHNLTSHRCSECAPPLPVCEPPGLEVYFEEYEEEEEEEWGRRRLEWGRERRDERRNDLGAGISVSLFRKILRSSLCRADLGEWKAPYLLSLSLCDLADTPHVDVRVIFYCTMFWQHPVTELDRWL